MNDGRPRESADGAAGPTWWSRPTTPDPAPTAPAERPPAGPTWWSRPAEQAAVPATPAPPAPAPRHDPWAAPLQLADPPRKRRRNPALLTTAVLLALVAGAVGGGIGVYVEQTGTTTLELDSSDEAGERAPRNGVAAIAARALPGVVTLHVQGGGGTGTGTGFVLDGKGHILTNNHVVDSAVKAGRITVSFSGGETASARIVGRDAGYDLAVVKVEGVRGLRPLPLGNSDAVHVGDPVVAIGAPFELSNTVTAGIISAKERPITAGGKAEDGSDISYVDALQTDAPINPGNSGGPLLDSHGRVIGINSAIRSADDGSGDGDDDEGDGGRQAGSIGLGFAIPINQGRRVAQELIDKGKATHPVIGVTLDMDYNGDGARVGTEESSDGKPPVTPGGPAAKAGIRPGDVITKVDGTRVHAPEELIIKIRAQRPGDPLTLTVVRGGRERTVKLVLGSANGS
ncbi:trypsin-like peptidase domain-containing protein [Streptomyces bambusae]|uniref:S1C family serine protease n=1 Tax=Streptomyces bambusae TaxID=1550616 RepID=UPI001CFDFFC0|nr:trypsin-like peptidase domain-containing protein [Streptomyces bambusae]MCB5166946.1 trypsin-like peptidase domain-containing protein [Streptomyces bambusae]